VLAQFKPIDVPTTTISTVLFTDVSLVLNGISYPMPNGRRRPWRLHSSASCDSEVVGAR